MRKPLKVIASGFAVATIAGAIVVVFGRRPVLVPIKESTTRTVIATTLPASKPAPPKPLDYLSAMREAEVRLVADHFLDMPVTLDDAARLRVAGPMYLDPAGHLWITRAAAAPVAQTLVHWADTGPTLLRERPVFVHWATDAAGAFTPCVVCQAANGYDFTAGGGVRHWSGPSDCGWSHAFSFADHVVVPTSTQVIVLDVAPGAAIAEHPMTLPQMTPGGNPPLAILDSRGVLAWSPWERGRSGSGGAMRFVDGQWSAVDAGVHLVQMVPLLDGSLLTIRRDQPDHVTLAIEPLESAELDRKHLADLIDKLSDDDPDVRDSAYAELSRYGPGLWPVLEQSLDDASPEAKQRIQRLLRGKLAPALGGMVLIDGKLDTVHRQPDGTAVFFASGGVELPGIAAEPIRVVPGWIAMHPGGRFSRPLSPELVADQTPDHFLLTASGDDWYSTGPAGPRRFLAGNWDALLKPEESEFDQMVGQDAQGRWVFAASQLTNQYLLLDPTLLDPTPRLPVWSIKIDGTTGMDKQGWPTITRGESSWALHEGGWQTTDKPAAKDRAIAPPPQIGGGAVPAVAPEALPTDEPLLVCQDGTRYFDGRTSLIIDRPKSPRVTWPLPDNAQGSTPAALVRTDDGCLYLFYAPGRVLRLKPCGGGVLFKLDAAFTHDIPNVDRYDKIWLDPAGRIDCTFNGNQLAVLFPSGHMPEELAHMQVKNSP